MTDAALPVIDIGPFAAGGGAARAVARRVDNACRESGFFIVTGHGVPEPVFAAARRAAGELFALPLERKLAVEREPESMSRGYSRFAERSLSYTLGVAAPPDLQEAWGMGRDTVPDAPYYRTPEAAPFFAPNRWPDDLPGFRAALTAYYDAVSDLAGRLMRIAAMALGLDADFFAGRIDRHGSAIRLIRYPAQQRPPEPGQLRAGEHTDYGTLTILRSDDVPGGLQVRAPGGAWIDVRPPRGTFVCNIGDAMKRWTGGRWASTLHRVGNPPTGDGAADRISIVFFHQPNYDALLDGIAADGADGAPLTFAEHFRAKIRRADFRTLNAE